MTTPQLLRFAVRRITFTLTVTGYKVTCYTNNKCHLFFRYTVTKPQKHVNPRIVRGAPVGTYIDQCFVSFKDNEQDEAGDTYTHTFIKEPWAICETRWFYFWGTVDGNLSPSASAIFEKHRRQALVYAYFNPDADPEVSSFDGNVARVANETWAQKQAGIGTQASSGGGTLYISISTAGVPGNYVSLFRSPVLFDTSSIPAGSSIIEAEIRLYCFHKNMDRMPLASFGIFGSDPISNTDIELADYLNFQSVPLSAAIPAADIIENAFNTIPLNAAGLEKIIPAGITKLGLREATWDAPNIEPPWVDRSDVGWSFRSADFGGFTKPRLKVGYSPPV